MPASGIYFRHRVVADVARTYRAVHYDHGNGIAIADVEGGGDLAVLQGKTRELKFHLCRARLYAFQFRE